MSEHGIEDRARVAAKTFLAGSLGAAETCLALTRIVYHDSTLLSEKDKNLIVVVGSETDALPVGKLKDNWHPKFLPAKLEQLARYEATIEEDVKGLCERLLAAMKVRAAETEER